MKTETLQLTPIAAAVGALLVAASATAFAQTSPAPAATTPDQNSQSVIVTGTRTPKAIDKIPGAVSVISSAEISKALAISEDATAVLARILPGYSESTQAMSNTGETLRGRIPLRLFDGIPQTSPLRETNRSGSFTDLGVVGRIEVIEGPSASEGIGASGGIINYISKSPTHPGNEISINSKIQSQFHSDSGGYKLGIEFLHRDDNWDLVFATSDVDRGIGYDGNGRRVGMNASGSLMDTEGHNTFLKLANRLTPNQRLELVASRFKLEGKGRYVYQEGDRSKFITDTAVPGKPFEGQAEFNDFRQYGLTYTNDEVAGGTFTATAYRASQAMRFLAEKGGADKQDPLIAPLGTLTDQSEVNSQKHGVRTGWNRADLFNVSGLELRAGVDVVQDETQQKLALTNRTWVPPMLYKSTAPYAQLSYDMGDLTVSGGYRREDGDLHVNSYTTTYYNKRQFVEGGSLDYKASLPNIGAVWKFLPGWSTYVSYSKGFTLPNVGIPLRNVNKPGQSVSGILDLQAIIADNKEVGFNWKGSQGSFGVSYYRSYSDFGVSLRVDPVTNDFIMRRFPVLIKGFEANGEYILNRDWRFTGLYSHIRGTTAAAENGPMNIAMGSGNFNPDKIGGTATWSYSDQLSATLAFTTLMDREINVGNKDYYEKTTGYTLFDLNASYQTSKYGTFSVGIENLFNKFYILTGSQMPGYQNYTAGRGRMLSVSHRITF